MNTSDIFNRSLKTLKRNSPEILTGLGVAGVVSTAYLTGIATSKASAELNEAFGSPHRNGNEVPPSFKEQVLEVWKFYIPPAISGAATIACIVGSSKAHGRRTAAAVAAYSVVEKMFGEYKEHVVEQIGKGKEQKIRDEMAQKAVIENPPDESKILLVGRGEVLCCEIWTGRYFKSDMETLRKAENEINHMVNTSANMFVTLSEFYDVLDIPHTAQSDYQGWNGDKLMELQFSAVLAPNSEPCLAFAYNYIHPTDRYA